MQSQFVQYALMAVFFGVFAIVGIAWFVVGIKTYGTGDYLQP